MILRQIYMGKTEGELLVLSMSKGQNLASAHLI